MLAQVFDDRGIAQRRNERSGPLQQQRSVRRVWVDLARHDARGRRERHRTGWI